MSSMRHLDRPTHSSIRRACVLELTRRNIWSAPYHAGPTTKVGVPDVIACLEGTFLGIEVKRPGENQRKSQVYQSELIRRSGGEVYVVHSRAELAKILDNKDNKESTNNA